MTTENQEIDLADISFSNSSSPKTVTGYVIEAGVPRCISCQRELEYFHEVCDCLSNPPPNTEGGEHIVSTFDKDGILTIEFGHDILE